MATNLYFSQKVKSEQDLYENIVIESLKMYGQDVYFLPRSIVAKDTVFSEDVVSRFDDAHLIEVYLENIDGYAGDGDLFTRFGVEIRDQANFVLSKRRWDEVMQDAAESQKRPYEGDLIYIPLSNSIFEITKVEDERPFYQLSNLPTYRLTCELFEYSGEQFQTGISADIIEVDFAYQYILTINDSATNNQGQSININSIADSDGMIAIVGEQDSAFGGFSKIEQTLANNVTITGEIIKWDGVNNQLYLTNVGADDGLYHTFRNDSATLQLPTQFQDDDETTLFITAVTENAPKIDNQQNDAFETEGDSFLDFSEGNPFGDPT
jgi:hypothetical protein